jgi:acyl carrier protein
MPGHNYIAPRGELEKELVDIWSGLLNLEKEKISTNANFFQLGGHSLRAITMSTKIHKQLDVRVPLTKIFQSPTIQALARYIENAEIEEFKPLHPVEKKEYYLLSSAQKRLYIIQQMELNSIVYNMPMIFPLEMEIIGVEINKEKLEHTIRRLIHRHESIRTYFHVVGTQMVQGIQPAHEVDFAIENYYIKDTDAAGESLPAIVKNILKKFIRPFDLTHAPLVRTGLFITREQRYILLVDMHHIISDLVSHDILIRDFTSLAAGRELPRLRLQYKDYAQWQNSVETKKSLNRQEEYWINEYKGEIPLLRFPVDYERTGNLHFQGDSVGFTIDRTLSSKIKVQARELNVTVMIYLFSLYDILIARYSGQEELVVGTVAAGRQHADLQNIIGFFVNMLPIKTRPHLDKTFSQYLAEVKEKAVNAYENQGYPFEELVSKLDIPREPGRHPLVDVVFAFQNQPGSPESPRRNNPEVQDFNFFNSARFDLMLHTVEEPDAIQMVLQYPSDLFKRSTIEEFTNFYLEILLQTVENPDIKLKEIKMNLQLMASSPGILQDSKDDWEL